ncbi:cardiolipin synthase ClsB [Lonsdalea quercina]|uniref:cardiolipin synthase ClsB n=1 Tax=Lonsdalea quercina TaxID=71657 RepID=UPI0039761CA8
MKATWRDDNQFELLINGDAFYPSVFSAIRQAQRHVILETFIWFEDEIGTELRDVLAEAAQRGVSVDVLADGFGSHDLSADFLAPMIAAGVQVRFYDPRPRLLGMRTNVFRRLHRKIVVVDGAAAWVGGINFAEDHMTYAGPEAKQDYAVKVRGPVVQDIYRYVMDVLVHEEPPKRWWRNRFRRPVRNRNPGDAQALFVYRDNASHRDDIEKHYLSMLRQAKREVVIANAYFFPGYRLLRSMRKAARRGVRVRLIVQGQPDMPIVLVGARMLYHYLLRAGVEIYEYRRRPLHGKIALQDDKWTTVGSSNLDPLSLALNLEANLIIHDRAFNRQLREHLQELMTHDSLRIEADQLPKRSYWRLIQNVLVFHFLRHFPAWIGWLPAHTPRLKLLSPEETSPTEATTKELPTQQKITRS